MMGFFKLIPWILIGLFWYAYATFGDTKCEKIERTANPIRVVLDGFSWIIKPWVSDDAKFTMMKWEIMADRYIREFIAQQAYKEDLVSMGCANPLAMDNDSGVSFKERLQGTGSMFESLKGTMEEKFNNDMEKMNPSENKENNK